PDVRTRKKVPINSAMYLVITNFFNRLRMQKARATNNGTLVLSVVETANAELRTFSKIQARAEDTYARSHKGSIAIRTSANKKTATAKPNATERTRPCSNFPDAL